MNACRVLGIPRATYYRNKNKIRTKKVATQKRRSPLALSNEECEQVPNAVAKSFKYVDIDPEMKSREIKVALEQLSFAGLLNRIFSTSAAGIPLRYHKKENRFKLLFVDIGLLQRAHRIDMSSIFH